MVVGVPVLIAAMLTLQVPARNGQKEPSKPEDRTALGSVLGREGALIIFKYANLGDFREGLFSIRIDAVTAWEAGREQIRHKGVRVTIASPDGASNSALLDADEVIELGKAIEHMQKVIVDTQAPRVTPKIPGMLEETRVQYNTKGHFTVWVSGGPDGFQASCLIEGIPLVGITFSAARLSELGTIVFAALTAIQSTK